MDLTDLLVVTAALATLAGINLYFFRRPGRRGQADRDRNGVQTAHVVVRGGYDPSTIVARAGVPLRLVFDRQDSSGCTEEIVLPDFGIRRFLPVRERTAVQLDATEPGTYEFTCGMGMLRGRLVLEAAS